VLAPYPDTDDVVVRQQDGNFSMHYLIGTPATPDQLAIRCTRDEVVLQAIAYARLRHVRAWFTRGNGDFVLLGSFREEQADVPPRVSVVSD
jgi:hypothetical protein